MSKIVSITQDRCELDDPRLVRACRRGDEEAWKELITRYRRLIYSVPVTGYRLSEPDAEEIFQRVAVKLFENISRLRKSNSLSAWIVTVTRNECRRWLRRSQRWFSGEIDDSMLVAEDPPDLARTLDDVEREHRLSLAFRKLDESSRELLHALYVEEPKPSYAEISKRLGRPIGSLGPTRSRCLKKLRRLYLELGGSDASDAVSPSRIGAAISQAS